MHIAGNEIIVAEEFITHTPAVTCGTRLFDGRILAGAVSRQESATGVRRTTDVTLSARRVTFGTVIVERFFKDGRVHVRAHCLQVGPIAVLIDMQIRLIVLDLGGVTETARLFRLRARFGDEVLVRGGFV